jgi:hypothetical protein
MRKIYVYENFAFCCVIVSDIWILSRMTKRFPVLFFYINLRQKVRNEERADRVLKAQKLLCKKVLKFLFSYYSEKKEHWSN